MEQNKYQYWMSLGFTIPLFFFLFFGFWTILSHLAIVCSFPYSYLTTIFFIALVSSVPVYLKLSQLLLDDTSDISTDQVYARVDGISCALLIIMILTLFLISGTLKYYWFWAVLLIALLIVNHRIRSNKSDDLGLTNDDFSALYALIFIILCGVVVTCVSIFSKRYDADDSFYLSIVVQALESPQLPTLLYESLNGLTDTIMPIKRRVCTYELLVAAFASISSLNHLTVYYVVFPIISAWMFVWLFAFMFKRLLITNKAVIVALIGLIVILLTWGDAHRTYGNFSFVRFFQGKSLLIQIFIPAAAFCAIQYIKSRYCLYLYLLGFVLVGASGVSVNGILLAPFTVLFVVLGAIFTSPKKNCTLQNIFGFFIVLSYPLLVALVVKLNPGGEYIRYFGGDGFPDRFQESYKVLGTVLGHMSAPHHFTYRTVVIIAGMITLPLLLPLKNHKKLFLGFTIAIVFVVFFPNYPFQKFLAEHASRNMMWRITWAVPFAFLAATCIGAIINSPKRKHFFIIPAVLLSFVLVNENWTISKENHTQWAIQPHKYSPYYLNELENIRPILPKGGAIIAPEWLTVMMSSLIDFPPLPVVRKMYLGRYEESIKRDLNMLSHGVHTRLGDETLHRFWAVVAKKNICSIIIYRPKGIEPDLEKLLIKNQFDNIKEFNGHMLWVDSNCTSQTL
ncbi:MAG: hypothetical protein GY705_24850 [Bacteroidetes bacterium]|nr:hypothetical protein [Bacteroidota bacterium]